MEENKTTDKTEEEVKQKRREYMKKYYRKRHYQIDENGNFCKMKPLPQKAPPIKITRGDFIVSFK